MRYWFWGILLLIILPVGFAAEQGTIKILAITNSDDVLSGSVADLSLDIIPGKGRVFLETFPVTKIDTQISMRFAQQFACSFVKVDCDDIDFIYTIRAGSNIIGGPSAGASATTLTIAMLDDLVLDKRVVITGTINPGGMIGGVGGIKEKIKAARDENFTTVLIPSGKRFYEEDNVTTDLVKFGDNIGIQVNEVASIEEVLTIYSDKEFTRPQGEIVVDEQYDDIMRKVSNNLCERNHRLREGFGRSSQDKNISKSQADLLVQIERDIQKAKNSFGDKDYYAAASFCFRANINTAYVNNQLQNISVEMASDKVALLKQGIKALNEKISEKPIRSITDLQTFLIVKERLIEANDHANNILESKGNHQYNLALSNERLYSAIAWSEFFKSDSPRYIIDKDSLLASCEQKIREAEERYQYVSLYIPQEPLRIRKDLDRAYADAKRGNPDLCLFKASQAKADADMVISILGAKEDQLKEILADKLDLARESIIQSQKKQVFPIIGYSYYVYAKSLSDDDIVSALRFTQYAIEMSSLDLYFKKNGRLKVSFDTRGIGFFVGGILIGALGIDMLYRRRRRDILDKS